jgi:pyrimidine-nucleoside phosphorylase/thymidine phosphorylase
VDIRSVVLRKCDGAELSDEEIRFFVDGCVRGTIADSQIAALLAGIFARGTTERELATLTRAMLRSGSVLSFDEMPQKKADKHSTGGIGDKVSIALAPAVAACGVCVPMISGRGLGHTGGTLDKLEAIPGFRVELGEDEIHRALDRAGAAFAAQTRELVPADRKLYALRDEIGLVASIPLIASSIMSKKLAEGIDALVLDVKFGSGAFLREPERGAELARTMLGLARAMNVRASAFQTAMDRPLGRAVGHALEIAECIDCLAGEGPDDLRELVLLFGGEMLRLANAATSREQGSERIACAIDSGRAMGVLDLVIRGQGGDPRVLEDRSLLPHTKDVDPWKATASGTLSFEDNRLVGLAAAALGGGRSRSSDAIDAGVGLVWHRVAGERVERGDVLCEIHHREGKGLSECHALLDRAVEIGPLRELAPLVLARLE